MTLAASIVLLLCIGSLFEKNDSSCNFRIIIASLLAIISLPKVHPSESDRQQVINPVVSNAQQSKSLFADQKHPRVVLSLANVRLDIPVFSNETRSLKSSLIRSVTGGKLRRSRGGAVITALNDLTCTFYEGDRVALIGHNGAGKTSFLRLISGIYQHTTGHLDARVRVFPMLHKSFITSSELSGMQAIKAHYLMINGSLYGFEAFSKDVIEFSGLGDFVHLPVKTYSQGMATRLLFAVLTSCTHECLALDEGLGAGDSSFFEKAQERLHDFLLTTGTLFLASHSDALLRCFCERGLVFEQGKIVFDGELEAALNYYHQST